MKALRAVDVCCGAGGWAIAARGLPIEIVAAVDHAYDCCRTYKYNHPAAGVMCCDVTRLDWERFAGVDLVLGGIPCEQISWARKGQPATDAMMTDFRELLDAVLAGVEVVQPRWWCIEDVQAIIRELPPLTLQAVIDSAAWSGQRRKRVYLGRFPLPHKNGGGKVLRDYLRAGPYCITPHVLRCTAATHGGGYRKGLKRVLNPDAAAPVVSCLRSGSGRQFVLSLPDGRERILTFAEAAGLQGFPEDYVFVAGSDRAEKMVGQAIQIDLGRAILRAICEEAGVLNGG